MGGGPAAFFANGCEAPAARHSPAAPARHRSPRQGRDSSYRGRDSDFALHRGRFSDFALASDFARKILRKRCGGIAFGVGFHPENPITGPAPKVRQRCCPRSIADGVFFSPLTRPAVNPAVATGLLHPILLWQQDCSTQSCCGNRIAPPNPAVATGLLHPILLWQQDCPGVSLKTLEAQCCTALRPQTRRPDCAENTGSASVHTDALPDSPPGLPGKLRKRTAV